MSARKRPVARPQTASCALVTDAGSGVLRLIAPSRADAAAGPAAPALPVEPRPVAAATSSRRGQIDSLRILAVVWVLFDHFWLESGSGPLGRLSVRLFLLISGYLITHILLRSRDAMDGEQASFGSVLRNFYARRALRIAPAYYLLLLLTWRLDADGFQGFLTWHLSFQSSILYALTGVWGPPFELAHLWTLSVQEQFYLLWPAVVLLAPRHTLALWIAGIAATGPLFRAAMVAQGLHDTAGAYTLLPASVTALSVGAFAAMLERRRAVPAWFAGSRPLWLLAAALVFAAANLLAVPSSLHYLVLEYVWLAPLAALLLSAGIGIGGPLGRVLDTPWLQYLGRISLGVYLYQSLAYAAAVSVLARAGLPTANGPAVFVATAVLSVAFAVGSWKLVESPVNGLKRLFPYPWAGRAARPAVSPSGAPALQRLPATGG